MMNTAPSLYHLNAGEAGAARRDSRILPSGIAGLDDLLPDHGWPKGGVVEIIVPDMFADATELVQPALRRLSRQGRTIAMVAPPFAARASVFTDEEINASHLLQVNPHPGRSALWTVESLLETGDCAAVLAWPGCDTELMGKRLHKAAQQGRSLCVLFRYEGLARHRSGIDVRLRLEISEAGRAVYRVNQAGESVSGIEL
jgi:cell division inhibitor SulA